MQKVKTLNPILIFQSFFNTEEKKRLFENFVSLSVLQGLNYLLPLVTFPYLVRVLGAEKFGLLAFATATIDYFRILTDYGFNLSATRGISIHREDKAKLNEIFSAVMIIKFGLLTISFLLLAAIVFSFEKFRVDWQIYILTFGMVVGQTFFPVWFFQGMERMKYITFLNILAKALFTIAIFIFVKEQTDFWKVPLLNSLGFILAGIISLYLIIKNFNTNVTFPSKHIILEQMKEGWHIFVSTVAISLYTISTPFILGLFTNNTIVGYYSAADKIIQAIKGLLGPFSQTIYPFINKKVVVSKEAGLKIIRKITICVAFFTFLLSISVFTFAQQVTFLVLGQSYIKSIIILKILAITPFLIGLSNVFGIQTMISFGRNRAFRNILICASVINIILSLLLVPAFSYLGSAIAVVIVEFFVTTSMFIYLQTTGIKIVEFKDV